MPTQDSQRTKRAALLEQIAAQRFPYPGEGYERWETYINVPDVALGVELKSGGWIIPDIVVAEEPGHFIQVMATLALHHEVTEAEARERWFPLAKAGALYLYVPAGQAGRANQLCQKFDVQVAGIRIWRQTVNYGVDIEEAYAGRDVFGPIARLLPPVLRPAQYRMDRIEAIEQYATTIAVEELETAEAVPAIEAPATVVAPVVEEDPLPAGVHLPPPSMSPALLALGMILTGFGFIFPAELLGAGVTLVLLGALGWLREDVIAFATGGHEADEETPQASAPTLPPGVHMPPPSMAPALLALGMILAGFGFIFPAELLGVGVTMVVVGALRWLGEDIRDFAAGDGGHGDHASHEGGEQHA